MTVDGGRKWLPFRAGMPSVKVTDLVIHPRENDLVVGTYGRGAYIVDISPLQEMTVEVLASGFHLFDVKPRTQRIYGGMGNYRLLGDSHLFTPNEPNAVIIHYYLKTKAGGPVKITVTDPYGAMVAEMTGGGEAGLNSAAWGMRPQRTGQQAPRFRGPGAGMVDPGEYVVTVEAGGKKLTKKAVIRYRQGWTVGAVPVKWGT